MQVGIITISDGVHHQTREDQSGDAIAAFVEEKGGRIVERRVVPDEADMIERALLHMADTLDLETVFTTGGTGLGPRDVTPEVTARVIDREVPGIAEAMRIQSAQKTPRAMLSRAKTGVRKNTLIINLPGSVKGVVECLEIVYDQLPHAVAILRDRPIDH